MSVINIPESLRNLLEEIGNSKPEAEETILITRFGRKFEQLFLGFTLPDEANLIFKGDQYITFAGALEEVRELQFEGYDPKNPSEGCNREFFESIRSFLPSSKDDLELLITMGTRMDFWHGADAVICWRGVSVTIDLTVDPQKISREDADFLLKTGETFDSKRVAKADILIRPLDLESGKVYSSIAREIVVMLLSRWRCNFERESFFYFSQGG